VRGFLRDEVMPESRDRKRFMARVAANSRDIVLREHALGRAPRAAEHARLRQLLGRNDKRENLRWALTNALGDGNMALDTPGLAAHLRATVVGELAIDQPQYSGLRTVLAGK
jgi:hypothetical protein